MGTDQLPSALAALAARELGASRSVGERARGFDQAKADVLRRLWFVGDVHGQRRPLLRLLDAWDGSAPIWLVFAGDIDLDGECGTFEQWLQPIYRAAPGLRVAWIPGNHDSDDQARWERLQACGDAVALHGRAVELDGVRVAGLGGTFQERVWVPPAAPRASARTDLQASSHLSFQEVRRRQSTALWTAIYPAEWEALGALEAEILVTHEAPSPHPQGFDAIDDLARALRGAFVPWSPSRGPHRRVSPAVGGAWL
jgi:Icc-related predicted phosphoesterase